MNGEKQRATSMPFTWTIPQLQAVTSHAAEYLQWWQLGHHVQDETVWARVQNCALLLLAAGHGRVCIPTCEHTLRYARIEPPTSIPLGTCEWRPSDLSVVVVRALSFFGPGGLRALCVDDADIFRLVSTMQPLSHARASTSGMMAQILDSVRVVEIGVRPQKEDSEPHAAAVIERCAPTLTELKGPLPARLLCESDREGHPPVLSRCTRLEVLTCVDAYLPAVWLGLSQLHTLRGVNIYRVSLAAVAAALPRLHTLTMYGNLSGENAPSVAGFFTDLLPRLRVFHFNGKFPPSEAANFVAPPAPLPLLEELVWQDRTRQPTLYRGFLGARPLLLHAPYELIAEGLPGRPGALVEPTLNLLVRACELWVSGGATPVGLSDVAQMLRAAPRLRLFSGQLHGSLASLTAPAAPLDPAFVGLVHSRLRNFTVRSFPRDNSSHDEGCASRLRQACFPRLREMAVSGNIFLATPG
jgi:hypothetical protein